MTSFTETETHVDHKDILGDIRAGRLPAGGERLDLRRARLAGFDLSGLNLANADLVGADLAGAKMGGANLTGADLTDARLYGADLKGALLSSAVLHNAELSGSDLTGAHLEGATATRAGFGLAKMAGAHLERACLDDASLSKADLTGACLRNASLRNARLREAVLTNADFNAADLQSAHLSLSDVTGATFRNADLRDARMRMIGGFARADWIGVDIRDVSFAGSLMLRRFIMDQNYIMEYRHSSRLAGFLYYPWMISSDCGRSLARWCGLILALVVVYGLVYRVVGVDYGDHETWFSPFYFSVVTITTLGYGDVVPATVAAQWAAVSEVVVGYMMLGGLLSIFSNKIARRAD